MVINDGDGGGGDVFYIVLVVAMVVNGVTYLMGMLRWCLGRGHGINSRLKLVLYLMIIEGAIYAFVS